MKASDIFSEDPSSVFSEYKKVTSYENFEHPVFSVEVYGLMLFGAFFSLIIAAIIRALGFFNEMHYIQTWMYTSGTIATLFFLLALACSGEHYINKKDYLKSKDIINKFESTFIYNHSNFKKLVTQVNWNDITYTYRQQITKAILERKFSLAEFEILQTNYLTHSATLFEKSMKSKSDNIYKDDTEIEMEPDVEDSQSLQFFGPKNAST